MPLPEHLHNSYSSQRISSANSHTSYSSTPRSYSYSGFPFSSQHEMQSSPSLNSDPYSRERWRPPTGFSQHELQSSPPSLNSDPYTCERWQPPTPIQVVLPVFSRTDIVNQSHSHGHPTTHQHHPSDPTIKVKNPKKTIKKKPEANAEAQAVSTKPFKSEFQKIRFERQDYLNIIAYLSDPSKYNALFGGGKKTSVTGQSMNVSTSWSLFSAHIQELYNQRHPDKPMKPTGRNLQLRFIRYRQLYCIAKRFPKSTGSGTSREDQQRGIYTYEQKLESLCPCYSEMDDLFGDKANVTAMREWDSLISDSEDDDDDDDVGEKEEEEEDNTLALADDDDDSDIEFQSGQSSKPIIGSSSSSNPISRPPTFAHLLLEDDEDILTDLESLSGTNGVFQPLSSTIENLEQFRTVPTSSKPSKGKQAVPNAKKPKRKKEPAKDAVGPNNVSRRNPLPPISKPSVVKTKENKNSLAHAFAEASHAKMLMFEKANQWEQGHEAKKMKLEATRASNENTRAINELAWAKEKFGLERLDRVEERRLKQMEKWFAEGKTVAEVEMLFRLATLPVSASDH